MKRRILLGTFALSAGYYDAYYRRALQVRTLVAREFAQVFEGCDAILSPVAPTVAYGLGEKAQSPMEMYLGDVYTGCPLACSSSAPPARRMCCAGRAMRWNRIWEGRRQYDRL